MAQRIQFRKGTAAQWTAANPTLAAGEPGFETDTGKVKFGDGATAWTALAYFGGGGGGGASDASSVAFTPTGNLAATDVQAALAELDTEKAATGHTHPASAVTYAGSTNLSATDVEAALDELDSEKASKVTPFVRVYRTTDYTLPGSTSTVIPYDNEADDTHGYHSNSTNPSRFTIPAGLGGVYVISLTTELANSDGTSRSAHVRLNGGPYIGIASLIPEVAGARVRPIVTALARLAAGDYIEAISNPGAGGSGLHYYAISDTPSLGYLYFSMARIGD